MDRVITARQDTDSTFGSVPKFSRRMAAPHQVAISWAAIAVVVMFALCSCETASRTARVDQVGPTTPVVLSAGDVVRISFSAAPDYNQSQKIRPDGKLSLPQVGEVVAAGKTVAQFESQVRAVYQDVIKETDVSVSLENSVIQIYVTGSVRAPSKYSFDRPTTILQAVMEAGGPNQFGNMRNVHLIRTTNGVHRTQLVDLRPALAGEPTHAMYVKNGDIIKVPESPF